MKLYRKFTQYLLEQYPLLWHSKSIQLLIIGLAINLLSFFIGFFIFDLEQLQSHSIDNYFWNSTYVFYYSIIILIIGVLWALSYFKNNALKKFYPSSRFYVLKLFLLLSFNIFIFLCGYYFFTYGVQKKIQSQTTIESITKDINIINQIYPFLCNANNYGYASRVYPTSYQYISYCKFYSDSVPVDTTQFSKKLTEPYNYSAVQTGEIVATAAADSAAMIYEAFTGPFIYRDAMDQYPLYPWRFKELGAKPILATENDTIYGYIAHSVDIDSCSSKDVLDSFVDFSLLKDFGEHQIINYSGNFISNVYSAFGEFSFRNLLFLERDEVSKFPILNYNESMAPKTYAWVKEGQYDSILSYFKQYQNINRRYKVQQVFSPEIHLKNLKQYNFELNEMTQLVDYANDDKTYYLNTPTLKTFFENLTASYEYSYFFNSFFLVLCLSFIAAGIIVFFEFANLIRFLIAIPIVGVIIFFFALIMATLPVSLRHENWTGYLLASSISFIIISLSLFGIYFQRIPKKLASIFFYIGYFTIPIFIFLICHCLVQLSEYQYWSCGEWRWNYSLKIHPYFILFLCLISYAGYTLLVKKYLAREE